jgi:spermidine/putrescine transport system substrate-binding protein
MAATKGKHEGCGSLMTGSTPDDELCARTTVSAPLWRGLTRRRVLGGSAAVAGAAVLSACGTSGTKGSEVASSAPDKSDTEKVVNWSNGPEYIDVDDKTQTHPTLEEFTKQTGIKVNYTEDINSNDEFFAKVQPLLSKGADCGRDTFYATDWMAGRYIRLGWAQQLDHANIPNIKNLDASLLHVPFDDGRQYTLPWQSGFTGIGYNPKSTGGEKVETIEQLLTNPKLKGKVTLLTEMRDTVGLVMIELGIDPSDFTDDEFDAAIAKMQAAVDAGQIASFTGNDYAKGLASGDIAACMAWTGDVVQLQADDPKLGYVLPAKGHMLWSDNFVIPIQAQHKKNAEILINYYFDPVPAAAVEDYVNYISPVNGAKEILEKSDPSVADNPLIFPDDAMKARSHVFMPLTPDQETKYNAAFQALVGA